jgi:hypothetical protein
VDGKRRADDGVGFRIVQMMWAAHAAGIVHEPCPL